MPSARGRRPPPPAAAGVCWLPVGGSGGLPKISSILPWTTLAYVLAWGPLQGVSGAGWLLVAIGVAADVATSASRAARSRYASA